MKQRAPQFTWINHASFLLEYGKIKLVSDPWIDGRVFNNSWDLLAKSKFDYSDFENVTHIWFSHEHPDHFSPPNINKIPEQIRSKITILYQETDDKKVVDFCRKKGFKAIIELKPYRKFKLEDDFCITNASVSNDTDSWLLLEVGSKVILNMNDCVIRDNEELRKMRSLYANLDVLLTQFSFANWVGNPEQIEQKKSRAKNKQEELIKYVKAFQPQYIIPFASYVWFCAEGNVHMNKEANNIQTIFNLIDDNGYTPIVMYPGEQWIVGDAIDSRASINAYQNDIENINSRKLTEFDKITWDVLELSAINYLKRAKSKNNEFRLNRYKPMTIFLKDHNQVVSFSFKRGLKKAGNIMSEYADVSICSQNLKYCFDFEWGYDTLQVAGTFEKPEKGNFANFEEYHWISTLNNKGGRLDSYFRAVLNKFKRTVG